MKTLRLAFSSALALLAIACAFAETPEAAPAESPAQLMRESAKAVKEGRWQDARVLLETVLAAEPGNRNARALLAQVTTKEAAAGVLQRQLSQAVIPIVDLSAASPKEAVEFVLSQAAKVAGTKANLVWIVPEDHAGSVTLRLENIPADVALRYVADAAGLSLAIEPHAVKVSKP